MRKFSLILLSSFLCFSCDTNKSIPSDIKDFVNGINFRNITSNLRSGEFNQEYLEKINGEITARNSISFTFSIFEDELNFHAIYTYEGTQIKDQISSKEITLSFIEQEKYNFEIKTNLETENNILDYGTAYEKFYKIFDAGNNSYRFGGLYYGDYFAINLNKFYNLYSLNEEKNILTIKEESAAYFDNLFLDQQIDIDQNGMLLYKKEYAKDKDEKNTGLLIQNANYVYIND